MNFYHPSIFFSGVIPDQFINAEKFMPTVNLPIILGCIPLDQGRELGYKQIEPMQGCGEYVTSTPFGFESRIFLILPLS